ncbi:MAG: GAF domain-containing protein [Chloroflexota bacterium]
MATETPQYSVQSDGVGRALAALKKVTATLQKTGNIKELLEQSLLHIVAEMDWTAGALYLAYHGGGLSLLIHQQAADLELTWKARLSRSQWSDRSVPATVQPVYEYDETWEPSELPFHDPSGDLHVQVSAPLCARDALVGRLFLVDVQPREAHPVEMDILMAIGHQLAHAVVLARLLVDESRARRMAGTLREVAQTISSSLNRNQVLDLILERLGDIIAYDTASVMLVQDDHFDVLFARDREGKEKSLGSKTPVQRRAAAWQVVHSGDPIVLTDVRDSHLWTDVPQLSYIRSWIGVPLKIRDQVIGVLTLDKAEPGFYQPSQVPVLSAFASQAAAAIENARLYDAAQHALAERTMLHEVSQAVSSSLELEAVLNAVIDAAIHACGAQRGYLVLPDLSKEKLQFLAARDRARETLQGEELVVSRSIARRVLETGEAVLTVNAQEDPRFADEPSVISYSLRSVVCVPLMSKQRVIGALYVDNRLRDGQFTFRSLDMLKNVAAQAATAVENALLYQQLREANAQLAVALEKSNLAYEQLQKAQGQLVQIKKQEAMIETAGAAAHELNQPLTIIQGIASLLIDRPTQDAELKRDLEAIAQAAQRAARIVQQMSDAARYVTKSYPGGHRIVDLSQASEDNPTESPSG